MISIPGYLLVEELHRSQSKHICRLQREADGKTFIAKFLTNPSPAPLELAAFRHEVRILQKLTFAGVPTFYKAFDAPGMQAMLTHDFEGIALSKYSENNAVPPVNLLKLAIHIAEILQSLHENQLIHKDIKPTNMLVQPDTLEVQIIDFGIASSRKIDLLRSNRVEISEGTLHYMSPEQTGRINRSVDHRTDLYSLGVTLYELATGKLPFTGNDPLEIVHAHIALMPEPPQNIVPALPTVLSEIIMKLLAKSSEARYNTASGLLHDLLHCESEYFKKGIIHPFELGSHDFYASLSHPQKLYGRIAEIKQLTDAYHRSLQGKLVRVFINGASGVGKSALVNELKKVAVSQRSFFLEGKFDQYNSGVAYSAILSALNDLIDQVLKETDEKLNQLAETLREKLGQNLGLMVELLPKLELVVGKTPPPPALTAKENESRFKLTFRSFIRAFTQGEHSIVVFVDDMQWADLASLNLMYWLNQNAEKGKFLMVCAFRTEALKTGSAFQKWLIDMLALPDETTEIELNNLSASNVNELVADLLQVETKSGELAELIYKKTAGNPFFIVEILRVIKEKDLILPKQQANTFYWHIDIDGIKKLDFSDNVIDLILKRVRKISDACASVMRSASCINHTFELNTLLVLHPEFSRLEMDALLEEAMQAELISPTDENYKYVGLADIHINATYAFVHDRVQQAINSSLTSSALEETHFKLALQGLTETAPNNEQLMATASHIRLALAHFKNHPQAIQAAATLVTAGQKSKENNSPTPAYLEAALELLPPNAWQLMPDLAFGAHLLLAESLFLLGNNNEAEQWYITTEQKAENPYHKAIAICLKMVLYIYSGRYTDGISEGYRALSALDYQLPEATQGNIEIAVGTVMQMMGGTKTEDLVNLPPCTDEKTIVLNNIMSVLLPSAFLAGNGSLWTLCVLDMTKLLLERGLTVGGAVGLSSFGMIMGSILGDKHKADALGEVALDITQKLGDHSRDSQLKFVSGAFLAPWVKNNGALQKTLDSAMTDGLQYGDIPYIGYSFQVKMGLSIYNATSLGHILEMIEAHNGLILSLGQPDSIGLTELYQACIADEYNDTNHLPAEALANRVGAFMQGGMYQGAGLSLHLQSAMAVIHRDYQTVLNNQVVIDQLAEAFFSNIMLVAQRTCYVVAKAQVALQSGEAKSVTEAIAEIEQLIAKTQAENQANNHFFANALALMQAMLQWLQNGEDAAIDALENVLNIAQETSNHRNSAWASEMLCRIFVARNKTTLAKAYLADALKNYGWYGAHKKAHALRQEMHNLLIDFSEQETTHNTSSMGMTQRLDYLSIIKSSQVLSAEMDLDNLLQEFLVICNQNAGAQRGICILINNGNTVRASFGYSQDEITYPETFVKYVQRTGEIIVSGCAFEDEKFASETYFSQHKTLSAIAAPVKYKNKLRGIIYLENNLTKGAFGKSVQELLRLLTNQIGISIENAELYANLEESNKNLENKVRARTAELSHLYAENEQLLLNMLPPTIAQRLKNGETYIADLHSNVSVMFTDVVNFTQLSEQLTPKQLVSEIHDCFKHFDAIIEKHGIEKIKTIGDAYLAVSGLHTKKDDHAHRLIHAAKEILDFIKARKKENGLFSIRVGISSGAVVAGVVGVKKFAYDIWGDTVNTAARMEQYSVEGKINISGSTHALIDGDFTCTYRGKVEAKNKGEIDMFFVE